MISRPHHPEHLASLANAFTDDPDTVPQTRVNAIGTIAEAGFGKLGYAFAIEDVLGRVFTFEHKPKQINGVSDHELGIPSETVKGRFLDDQLVEIETFEHCLGRCLLTEQGINLNEAPENARFQLTRQLPFFTVDWVMTHDPAKNERSRRNTFGFVGTVRANGPMQEFIALNATETDEGYGGFFRPLDALKSVIDRGEPYRPAFDLWLEAHLMHSPQKLEQDWVDLEVPTNITDMKSNESGWRGLRFEQLGLTDARN